MLLNLAIPSRFAAFESGDDWNKIEAANPWLTSEVLGVCKMLCFPLKTLFFSELCQICG